jgi:hypothetical protein
MTSALEQAVDAHRKAQEAAEEARRQLATEIAAAAGAGVRQVEIVRVTGYTRERVRQICRAAGAEYGMGD